MATRSITAQQAWSARAIRLGAASSLLFTLVACEAFQDLALFDPFTGKAEAQDTEAVSSGPLQLAQRDVETPSAFSVKDKGIWDGRPSLGGIWVAYPGNVQPERVNIRNEDNGKTVVGALFKRERQNPGPPVQVSSDAANALGIVPGKPVTLSVVALRREAVETNAKPAPVAAKVEEPEVEIVTIKDPKAKENDAATASDDAAQTIAAAVAAVQPQTPAPVAAAPQKETAGADGTPTRAYVQVGIFAREENANRLARKLTDSGILATARALDAGTRTLYRVIAGPAGSVAELNSNLAKIKAQGFADAYTVTR